MKNCFLILISFFVLFPSQAFSDTQKGVTEQISVLKSATAEHKEKWAAKDTLVRIGTEAVDPLIEILKDEKASYYAIRALGEIRDDRAVDALSQLLLDRNYGPRRYAAIALGAIRSPRAIPALQKALADVSYVVDDAMTALLHIDPSQGAAYVEKLRNEQKPNGLEIKMAASKHLQEIKIAISFINRGNKDFYVNWPGIYQAAGLLIQDEGGRILRPLRIAEYDYRAGPSEFHQIRSGETFKAEFKGTIKMELPAIVSRSGIETDWWNILYPAGPFQSIDFHDTAIDIGILKGKTFKVYFVFEQGESAQHWGKEFGREPVWVGQVVAGPEDLKI